MDNETGPTKNVVKILNERLLEATANFAKSSLLAKDLERDNLLQFIREMSKQEDGYKYLYKLTPKIVESGFFEGGGWEREDKLLPELVRGSFMAGALYPYIEIISNFRVLAIAEKKISSQYISCEEAMTFLTEMLALNLDILFDTITEESRVYEPQFKVARSFFDYLTAGLDTELLFEEYSKEVRELAYQRPIVTDQISALIRSGSLLMDPHG